MAAKQILVVDDEALVLDAVRLTLTHYSHEVDTASSGAEALQKLQDASFDLVITDFKMPGMTGEQLAAQIKARNPNIPVILLTGHLPNDHPTGVDCVLLKPFSTEELRTAVASLTGDTSANS